MSRIHFRKVAAAVFTAAGASLVLGAAPRVAIPTPSKPTLAVLAVHLDLHVANAVLPGDSALAPLATNSLRAELATSAAYALIDAARMDSAAGLLPPVPAEQRAPACAADPCALELARALGADRVLVTKLTKISTPVWYVHTRLLDVATGQVIRADEFELKGAPELMIPAGMRSVARRVGEVAGE